MSDHDPILLDLGLDVQYVVFCTNVYTPHASWKIANDADLLNYRSALSRNLASLNLQTEVLTCHDIECDDNYHFHALADYVKGITDASQMPVTVVYHVLLLIGRPTPGNMIQKTFDGIFLFKAGNWARKYHYGPGFQKHPVAKMRFDLEGQIWGSKVK